jgi:hypothetical protein
MPLQLRRGTNAQRLTITPLQGEIIYTTDTKNLYVGDGTTVGGTVIAGGGSGGSYTDADAQAAAAALFTDATHTGITFVYDSVLETLTATVTGGVDAEQVRDIASLMMTSGAHAGITLTYRDVDDALDFELDLDYLRDETYTSLISGTQTGITVTQELTGEINLDVDIGIQNLNDVDLTAPTPVAGDVLAYDGTFWGPTQKIAAVEDDLAPILGGALDLNNYNITGTGDIVITGTAELDGIYIPPTTLGGLSIHTEGSLNDDYDLFTISTWGDTDLGAGMDFSRARGTVASPTTIQNGDVVWTISYNALGTVNYGAAAYTTVTVDGAPGAEAIPGRFNIYTGTNRLDEFTVALSVGANGEVTLTNNTVEAGLGAGEVDTGSGALTYLKVVLNTSNLGATLATGTAIVTLTYGSTQGLFAGQVFTIQSGTGEFGVAAEILSVDSLTQVTMSVDHAVAGAVVFGTTKEFALPLFGLNP